MKSEQQKNILKIFGVLIISLVGLLFLPVSLTLYSQPNDGNLKPADAITAKTPLQQCINNEYENISTLDIFLATYARENSNTNHIEIFTLNNNQKYVYFKQDFNSQVLKDNDYFSINFPEISKSEKICFLISSSDGTATNSITYWLNSQSQPVLKLKTTLPVYKAIVQMIRSNPFQLPNWIVFALCFTYIFATVGVIFLVIHEKQQQ